jgi:HAD superfamily hydrolase (TIGR01509 family)
MAAELLFSGREHLSALRAFRREHERLRAELVEPVDDPYSLQLERTAGRLGCDVASLRVLVQEWMIQRPRRWIARYARRPVLDDIAAARARGLRVALVSDYPARDKLAALGALDLFDHLCANGESGGPPRLKPWPDGYLMAARALGVEPADCIVLGDRPDADGEAARRAGMRFRLVR